MPFIPGTDISLLYAIENVPFTVNEPTVSGGVVTVTMPPPPANPVLLGYTDKPQIEDGWNNAKGFAAGAKGALYDMRVSNNPNVSFNLRPGNKQAVAQFLPAEDVDSPYYCIYASIKDRETICLRYCKPASAAGNFGGTADGGGEFTLAMNFLASAYQRLNTAFSVTPAMLRALGTPVMWHDVRRFVVTDSQGAKAGYRRSTQNIDFNVDFGTVRKTQAPNQGDDDPTSMMSLGLLQGHTKITGNLTLHEALPEATVSGFANARSWDDIEIQCSDAVNGEGFLFNFVNPLLANRTQNGGDSNTELDYTIPFAADYLNVSVLD